VGTCSTHESDSQRQKLVLDLKGLSDSSCDGSVDEYADECHDNEDVREMGNDTEQLMVATRL